VALRSAIASRPDLPEAVFDLLRIAFPEKLGMAWQIESEEDANYSPERVAWG
jgi:hypothetical protein